MPAMAVENSIAGSRALHERRSTRKAVLIWSFLAPSLLIFLLYRILPLGWNVVLSFEAWSPLKPAVFIGLDNYQEMLYRRRGVLAGALEHARHHRIGARSASRGARRWRCWSIPTSAAATSIGRIIFLSYPLMTVAVAIIWRWMFDERVGLINYVARSFHLVGHADPVPQFLHLGAALASSSPISGRCSAST